MKVLVTGAAGFIGSHVTRILVEQGYEVRGLHLPGENLHNLRGVNVELMQGDITDADSMAKAVKGCQNVIHLAAIYALWLPDPSLMRKVNVEGTRIVLEACRNEGVKRIVCTSSIARFGGQGLDSVATEKSSFALARTKDQYAITKAEGHEVAVQAARDGQDVVIVAPTGPIGPGDIGPTPTGKLVLTCAIAPFITVPPTVSNFGDVRDIALGHVLAMEKGRTGESYLLGEKNYSAKELAEMASDIMGVERTIVEVPFVASEIAGKAALWFTDNFSKKAPLITPSAAAIGRLGLAADCSKAVRELGLPQSSVKNALRDSICWFVEEGYIKNRKLVDRISELSWQR